MATASLAVGLLLAACAQGIPLRQELLARAPAPPPSGYPEHFYTAQLVDHSNPADNRTFGQRYFMNMEHYRPGGPVLLTIGGEGPLSDAYVSGYLTNVEFARQTGGAVVAVEHRFYGKSQPFGSLATENLALLTSRQALADLARFQRWFVGQRSDMNQSAVFCMGGSYPGNLAAWYRLKYPELTQGCWAASGPVHAVEDWPGFGQMVWKAVSTSPEGVFDQTIATKLYAGYNELAGLIHDPTPGARLRLEQLFHVCPGTLVSEADRANLETAISTFPGLVMQYNNTRQPKLDDIRRLVEKAPSALAAAVSVSEFLNISQGVGPNNCTDNSIGAMYAVLMESALPASGEANAARTWFWQTCNEFGYFQTATSEWDRPSMYTLGVSDRRLWQGVCEDVYGIEQSSIGARIAQTNEFYGAKSPEGISNVLFSNGGLDAWSLLSITDYPANAREVYTEVAPLGSHCVGLYPATENEVPGATRIRDKAIELFKKWMK